MSKEENVIKFYVTCNKLKNIIRTGWKDWKVNRERIESVAEHVYGVQMLALAIYSEYQYDIDIMKVIMMLAVHELEETKIGDLTHFQITRHEKEKIGHEAIEEILSGLLNGEDIKKLILEFDEGKTKEAHFAHLCDKLECDIQSKIYDEEGCVDIYNQKGNNTYNDDKVQELLKQEKTFSGMWLSYGQIKYDYDENFIKISNYTKKNKILR